MAGNLPEKTEGTLQRKLNDIERNFQRQQHKVFTAAPLAGEIPEGGLVIARISGVTYIYTKVNGQRSGVAMTDV